MLPMLITEENLPALAELLDASQGRAIARRLTANQLLQAAQELELQLAADGIVPDARPGAAGLLSAEGPAYQGRLADATQAVLLREPAGWQVQHVDRVRIPRRGIQCLLNLSHAQAEFVYQQKLQKKRQALPAMTRQERQRALREFPALIRDFQNPLVSEFEMVATSAPYALEYQDWAAFARKSPGRAVRLGLGRHDLGVWHSVLYGLADQPLPEDVRSAPDEPALEAAIRKYPPAIQIVPSPSASLGELVVSLDSALIVMLHYPTARQQLLALQHNPAVRPRIKHADILAEADKLAVALQLDWQNPAHADLLRAILPPLPDREPGQTP